MLNVFKSKASLYRIYFCSVSHRKSEFCQSSNLSLYMLTLCDYKNFVTARILKDFKKESAI